MNKTDPTQLLLNSLRAVVLESKLDASRRRSRPSASYGIVLFQNFHDESFDLFVFL